MTTARKIGIWMDHANANLMEFNTKAIKTKVIHADTPAEGKHSDFGKNENLMHNKEQHQQNEYYKKIGEEIKKYNEVILFGPTQAKVELLNWIGEDMHFSKIKIEVKQADKMTENQQHAFVKAHFSKHP
jgi:stalled ribosome rescue protein Dom34